MKRITVLGASLVCNYSGSLITKVWVFARFCIQEMAFRQDGQL
jgi:hypothetical protein